MKKFVFVLLCFSVFLFASLSREKNAVPVSTATMRVADVLNKLGEPPAAHQTDLTVIGASADQGREIVLYGQTSHPAGGKSDRVSKHFVCTSCHNVERDEPNLSKTDPMARLYYVKENGLPYLQGSALYGIVNRRSFYNGDYEKKYGELVKSAHTDLRLAIQLCATECSQGRPLEPWEMESVLAYLWTIDLKMSDLGLSDRDLSIIDKAVEGRGNQAEAVNMIRSAYLSGMPATFVNPPEDRRAGAAANGNPETGKLIYELSCLHCHEKERYSYFNLDESHLSLSFLDRHFPTYSRYSVYQVARYGTSPLPGKRAYMPNYTLEKMSVQMLEDLRAYLRQSH